MPIRSRSDLTAWTPSAAVFDCDGLLVDTEPCWSAAEAELFARKRHHFGPAEKALFIGKSVPVVAKELADYFEEHEAPQELAEQLAELLERAVARHSPPLPGAIELVTAAARRVPVAVVSKAPRRVLDIALRRAGFADLLPVTVAADEVGATNLEPDLYLSGCAKLRTQPARCLAFEDSLIGVRSAWAAGLRTVGVPTISYLSFPADIVFPTLADERLLAWVETW